jgi:hypothetical protein
MGVNNSKPTPAANQTKKVTIINSTDYSVDVSTEPTNYFKFKINPKTTEIIYICDVCKIYINNSNSHELIQTISGTTLLGDSPLINIVTSTVVSDLGKSSEPTGYMNRPSVNTTPISTTPTPVLTTPKK